MTAAPRYRATINRGGALIADTKRFLVGWDDALDLDGNLRRTIEQNTLAKGSRTQVQAILSAITARYFVDADGDVGRGLVRLARTPGFGESLDRLLYYLSAKADPLIYDAVVEFVRPRYAAGFGEVSTADARVQLQEWIAAGRMHVAWNAETTERAAQGLLATLRDFGILTGVKRKRITPPFVPDAAFALLAFLLHRSARSGEKTIDAADWCLFFLERTAVERLLVDAHQLHDLTYAAAGNVVRIDFAAATFEEQVRVVVARSSR